MEYITLPRHLFSTSSGIGIDFGSSAIKIIVAKEVAGQVRFSVTRFSSDQVRDALLYIKTEADPESLKDGDNISSVGVQVNVHAELFEEILGVRPRKKSYSEGDTIVDAFLFLAKHVEMREFICDVSEEALAAAAVMSETWKNVLPVFSDADRLNRWPCMRGDELPPEVPLVPESVEYPVIVAHCGSNLGVSVLYADGRYEWCDINPMGGRTFLGLGSLLAGGNKSFAELLSLAENGDHGVVHQLLSSINSGDNESQAYKLCKGDMMLFAFGNAANKSTADIAVDDQIAALLSLVGQRIASDAFKWALVYNIQHCYFTGGLASYPAVQKIITQQFQFQNLTNVKGFRAAHHFVRHGAHLGALGALIRDMNPRESDQI